MNPTEIPTQANERRRAFKAAVYGACLGMARTRVARMRRRGLGDDHAVRFFVLLFVGRPHGGGAADFWTSVTGSRQLPCSEFAQGFASGAVRHWRDSGGPELRRLGPSEN